MQINRLFGIVHILLNQKNSTTNELATRFEVSKRTILRDIDTLSTAGVPIYTTKGRGGGIAILDNYTLNKMAISDQEQDHILLALHGLQSLCNTDDDHLLPKLSAMFGKTQNNWIEVDFSNWGYCDRQPTKFDQLKSAILTKQVVEFSYANGNGEINLRTVLPLKLLFKSQAWYLQAYCRNKSDYRFFKISRIHDLHELTEHFDHLSLTPPPIANFSSPNNKLITLTMTFLPELAYRVYDEFAPQYINKNIDNSLTVTIDAPSGDWLIQYLLSFGSKMEVIAPTSIRTILKEQIKQIKNLYP